MKYQEQLFTPLEHHNPDKQLAKLRLYDVDNNLDSGDHLISVWDAEQKCRYIYPQRIKLTIKQDIDKELVEKDKKNYIRIKTKQVVDAYNNVVYDEHSDNIITEADRAYLLRQNFVNYYPGLLEEYDKKYYQPGNRDVVEGIEKFIRLKYSDLNKTSDKANITESAYNYLKTFGYTELPGFQAAWEMLTNLYKLPKTLFK